MWPEVYCKGHLCKTLTYKAFDSGTTWSGVRTVAGMSNWHTTSLEATTFIWLYMCSKQYSVRETRRSATMTELIEIILQLSTTGRESEWGYYNRLSQPFRLQYENKGWLLSATAVSEKNKNKTTAAATASMLATYNVMNEIVNVFLFSVSKTIRDVWITVCLDYKSQQKKSNQTASYERHHLIFI